MWLVNVLQSLEVKNKPKNKQQLVRGVTLIFQRPNVIACQENVKYRNKESNTGVFLG